MEKISRIMCVIDPTTDEQFALQRASWIAESLGAELELFVSYYNEYLSGDRFFDSPSLAKARAEVIDGYEKKLEQIAKPLRERGISVKTCAVWDHPLYEGIVRHAAATGADLVFKDTHRHSAASRALLTNTDWHLIRSCASPLWLVKPQELPKELALIAAIDPMNEHDKPAALDDEIIVIGKTLAKACGGTVHAFHSFDPRMAVATATANAYIPVSLPFDEIEKQMREQHEKRFREITAFHDVADDESHLTAGLTHEELPELAEKINATAVVMGAVARNRLKRMFIGATAERVLDRLPCDLIIVKPDWFRTPSDISKERAA
jgi:universal stress protein E